MFAAWRPAALAADDAPMAFIEAEIASHAGKSGAYVLDTGEEALLARAVEAAIETDMAAGNSWDAAKDDPDQYVSFLKRSKAGFYELLPIKPLL